MNLQSYLLDNKEKNNKIYIYGYNPMSDAIFHFAKSIGIDIDGIMVSKGYEQEVRGIRPTTIERVKDTDKLAIIIAVKKIHYNDVIPGLVRKGIDNIYFVNGTDDYSLLEKFNDFYYRASLDINEIYKAQEHFYEVAKTISNYLSTLISVKSVVEFGCGAGTWLKAFKETFKDIKVLGLDISDVDRSKCLNEGEFLRVDFENYKWDESLKYDLAISIEVAEHLDEQYADNFIDNICKSSDIVLFSAASKYQGGDHHVNEQLPSYWVRKFSERRYNYIDCIRPTFWDDELIDVIYKQNMFLYVKEDQWCKVSKKVKQTTKYMDWIHPDLFSIKMEQAYNGILC